MQFREDFITLAIALALGLLVGMQRERANSQLAGFRTFALITIFGALAAMLARSFGGWVVAAGFLGIATASAMGNVLKLRNPAVEPGITTEVAALVMYAIGAFLVVGDRQVAVVVAAAVAVLLYAKPIMHGFARRMGEQDMRGIMQFVLIALVILPVLPNKEFGPFQVLNPREIWWMVVLVTGISFGGYIALKLLGQNAGAVLGGLLGGTVSSTATTVSYARRASSADGHVAASTLVIMLASTVVYVRVLVEVALVARPAMPDVAPPIIIMLLASIVLSVFLWLRNRRIKSELPPQENPTELRSAIIFGAMYAAISFAVAAAKHYFNNQGLYAVAAISGLTDMDAITLSTSRMVVHQGVSPDTAWRAILIASMANLVFKAGIVASLGSQRLFRQIALLFGFNFLVGIALLLFWPGS